MPRIDAFLEIMHKHGASDLHIGVGSEPVLRINGVLERTRHKILSQKEVNLLLYELLTDKQIEQLEKMGELDLAYSLSDVARFRINIFKKYPGLAAAFRMVPNSIPTLDSLGFPETIKKMLSKRSGLILVTGPTNSGKSTSQAAMVDFLNDHMNYHIITLEDPLEFIHKNKNCLIHQRQIGEHSLTFANALRAALREDPNVILVGEMRDSETISLALSAAEVGLLVLGTLHTKSAAQTISRIVDIFPPEQQPQVRLALSEVLIGICSQQLIKRSDRKGRVAAIEILVMNYAIGNLIRESKQNLINNAIMTGKNLGMQLMDQHIKELISKKIVTPEEAAPHASDPKGIIMHGSDAHTTS